jgi:hypothetical protein
MRTSRPHCAPRTKESCRVLSALLRSLSDLTVARADVERANLTRH